ncbi:MAG: hypothetical protein PHV78_02675 [Patescibacteria group bacterium]|nr:hypothetical protein [Patescibacteria group bacterium]MDD5121706.1 hypothetical protein [Patescibacteria group bacterium]MDD5221701.1 hypothetical protein [Patescibacteria group bacterium]MDD5396130.1 hypothetical protein [Patescibacteria group bacterium]
MAEEKQTQNDAEMVDRGEKLVEWNFTEYVHYQRTRAWYVLISLIGLALIIYSVLSNNFLFALITVLVIIILVLHSRRQPMDLSCAIFEDGIQVGGKFYEWDNIRSFRIVYRPPQAKLLYIDLKNFMLSDFSIPLNDQNPLELRDALKQYLTEELDRPYENITDRINRWLKI